MNAPATTDTRAATAASMLSLALQLRRNGHEYRRWAAQHTASGHLETAAIFAARADRYASDAIWYWRRGRNT